MLTVKQIVKNPTIQSAERSVRIWEAKNVELTAVAYGPTEEFPDIVPYTKAEVHFEMPDGTHSSIDHGIVYVQNDTGKTIDTFRLIGSEFF